MIHMRSTRRLAVMVTSAIATFEPSIQDMHAKTWIIREGPQNEPFTIS